MVTQQQLSVVEALEIRIAVAKSDLKKLLAEHEDVEGADHGDPPRQGD